MYEGVGSENKSSTTGSLILQLLWGYNAESPEDPLLELADRLMYLGTRVILPGAALVNDLPFCEYFFPFFRRTSA